MTIDLLLPSVSQHNISSRAFFARPQHTAKDLSKDRSNSQEIGQTEIGLNALVVLVFRRKPVQKPATNLSGGWIWLTANIWLQLLTVTLDLQRCKSFVYFPIKWTRSFVGICCWLRANISISLFALIWTKKYYFNY